MSVFYSVENVPVHDVLLMPTRELALSCPRGDIGLGFCPSCGFISNVLYAPSPHQYSSGYESTQAFSPTFSAFARKLATDLIARYDLHDKDIIEIGCGMGEFLLLLCELGPNRGIGFDPAYLDGRVESPALERVTFVKDLYSDAYAHLHADFICCKMTLEHISDTGAFVRMVRQNIGEEGKPTVFFQVPDVMRILRELAFWDIYYEHCSYFSRGSLARLFQCCGFEVLRLWKAYDDQYLMLAARPAGAAAGRDSAGNELQALSRAVERFAANVRSTIDTWRLRLDRARQRGERVALWGGSSKAVAFAATLGLGEEIAQVVDINPQRQGTFLPGSGHEIVAPLALQENPPDVVIAMNPIYRAEIAAELQRLGVPSRLLTVHDGDAV